MNRFDIARERQYVLIGLCFGDWKRLVYPPSHKSTWQNNTLWITDMHTFYNRNGYIETVPVGKALVRSNLL